MKKIFISLLILVGFAYGQKIDVQTSDTLANSGSFNVYIDAGDYDGGYLSSIALSVIYSGEIDVDHIIAYGGARNASGTFVSAATLKDSTITVNNADGVATCVRYSAASLGLNDISGYEVIKISFTMASSGNASTGAGNTYDNYIKLKALKYYTR